MDDVSFYIFLCRKVLIFWFRSLGRRIFWTSPHSWPLPCNWLYPPPAPHVTSQLAKQPIVVMVILSVLAGGGGGGGRGKKARVNSHEGLWASTAKKFQFVYSQKRNYSRIAFAASVPISTYNHVSVSDLYIHTIGPSIFLQLNIQTNHGNIEIAHRNLNVGIGTAL